MSGLPASADRALESSPLWESANQHMAQAIATARRAAASDAPILLTGEAGTGKRTLAAAIHGWSNRPANAFATIWCDALAQRRFDYQQLPHVDAVFSAAQSVDRQALNGGTLYLDGIGNLPISFQLQLLRFLEDQAALHDPRGPARLDVRLIASSSRDPDLDVRAGRLREDLFFRLSIVHIRIPPLRERADDLPRLRDHFLARLAHHYRRAALELTADAERVLAQYAWPGNVRELMTILERAVVLAQGDRIDAEELSASLPTSGSGMALSDPLSLAALEQRQIQRALEECTTIGEAAARLGIDPTTLWRKRKRYGIDTPAGAERRILHRPRGGARSITP